VAFEPASADNVSDAFVLALGRPISAIELARSISVRGQHLAWLVGAGGSAMSGIPTAAALIFRIKLELYAGEHGYEVGSLDPSDRAVRGAVEGHFNGRNGLPPIGDATEYAVAFERAYRSPADRGALITELVRECRPNYAHYVMAALMAVDRLRAIATTNFDDLIEQAAHSLLDSELVNPRRRVAVADLENSALAPRALTSDSRPVVVKLHGDFVSDRLMNTPAELQRQDAELETALREIGRRFGLVVVGYSGRDQSVMATLGAVLDDSRPFPHGLYWCYRPPDPPSQQVMDFLARAQAAGVDAALVAVDNMVELGAAIDRQVSFPDSLREWLRTHRPAPMLEPAPFPSGLVQSFPVLRLNALPLGELPPAAQLAASERPVDLHDAQAAIRHTRARGLVGRKADGNLVCFGHFGELTLALRSLGVSISEAVVPLELDEHADRGLVLDALTIGLGRSEGLRHVLRRRGHYVRVADPSNAALGGLRAACRDFAGIVPRTSIEWAEAVQVTIERCYDKWWLLFAPEIWLSPSPRVDADGHPVDIDQISAERAAANDFVRERLVPRYNRVANSILQAWVDLLTRGQQPRVVRAWNLRAGEGLDPSFEIYPLTAYSRPLQMGGR
jgi:NAD-dependent SIR2 family protein deacetylase